MKTQLPKWRSLSRVRQRQSIFVITSQLATRCNVDNKRTLTDALATIENDFWERYPTLTLRLEYGRIKQKAGQQFSDFASELKKMGKAEFTIQKICAKAKIYESEQIVLDSLKKKNKGGELVKMVTTKETCCWSPDRAQPVATVATQKRSLSVRFVHLPISSLENIMNRSFAEIGQLQGATGEIHQSPDPDLT